jgi:hypothetical protein
MATSQQDLARRKPNLNECHTERIVDGLSRCLANNSNCRYALPAGSTTTYCMHRNNMKFQSTATPDAPEQPVKAVTFRKR